MLTLPSLGWLMVFFILPSLIIFAIAFRTADAYGGIGDSWTLETILRLVNPNYPGIIWRTIWLSVSNTVICLAVSIPVAYYLARMDRRWRQWAMLLVVVPFWTNFLVRVFAWKTLLHTDGTLRHFLVWTGILGADQPLLYNSGSILLVLVYTYLPFAILPLYAAAEKFDFNLLEAARDLGASSPHAFFSVFMPGISRGIVTASIMVLVPSLGSYVIPEMLGGVDSDMLGNKIAQYVYTERNLPRASALAAVLILTVLIPLLGMMYINNRRQTRDRKEITDTLSHHTGIRA
jgi:spermidine/putrescine transport system permease protein